MQQIYLHENNDTPLNSKLKKKTFPVSVNVIHLIKKGTEKIVRNFRRKKLKLNSKALVKQKQKKARMEKRVIILSSQKKRKKYNIIHIQSTHNNTIYTASRAGGKTECCISTGMCGFKNTRKATSYASQATAEKLASLAKRYKAYNRIFIKMKGLGPGKLSGVRALNQCGFRATHIQECTALPHNGCRLSKRRRL